MLLIFKNHKAKGQFEVDALNDDLALEIIDNHIKRGYSLSLTDEVEDLLLRHGKIKKYD